MFGTTATPMGQEREPVFLDLQDTPMFKNTVDELQTSAKKLKDKCTGLLTGAKKYRDALAAMTEAQQSFAGALHEFSGSDQDSLLLGSAVMTVFVKAFKELGHAFSFIQDCVEKDMIEVLQQTWLDGHLTVLREEVKKYEKRCSDHEGIRLKHLALKKVTKRDVIDKSAAELSLARQAADEARYELARHLNTVEVQKRHAFLTMVVGVVYQHLAFFRQGATLLSRIEGPYSDALGIVEHVCKQGQIKKAGLEDMIHATRDATAAREALILREVAAAAAAAAVSSEAESPVAAVCCAAPATADPEGFSPLTAGHVDSAHPLVHSPLAQGALGHSGFAGSPTGVGGVFSGFTGSAVISAAPGGPVQLTAAAAGLIGDIERLIRNTQNTGGREVTIIKQGYLTKKSQGKGRHDWKRRFFVLDSTGLMYYYSHKSDNLMQLTGRGCKPKNTLPLLTSTVKMDADDPSIRCSFRVVSPEGTYTLQAESEFERAEWIAALQGVIGVLLNSSLDPTDLPRVPVRPTHSRHNSYQDISLGELSLNSSASSFGPSSAASSAGGAPMAQQQSSSAPNSPLSVIYSSSQEGTPGGSRTTSGAGSAGSGGGAAAAAAERMAAANAAPLPPSPLSNVSGANDLPPRQPRGSGTGNNMYQQQLQQGSAAGSGSSRQQQEQGGGSGSSRLSQQQQQMLQQHHRHTGSGGNPVLDRLRPVPGNKQCADCGGADPDWASLNLGILLCIECSGVHRQLGVHISKVRSCTLDVKVWEKSVLEVFESIGNTMSNSIWEAALPPAAAGGATSSGEAPVRPAAAAAVQHSDSWVWDDEESDGDETEASKDKKQRQQRQLEEPSQLASPAVSCPKPSPNNGLAEKSRYIQDKYVGRRYTSPGLSKEASQAKLWDAVQAQDIRLALQALAARADINAAYRTPRAQRLVRDTSSKASSREQQQQRQDNEEPPSPVCQACGTVTVLHAAAVAGSGTLLEFLLQNGASWQHTDAQGRSPLHYALLHDSVDCAKQLLKKGGSEIAGIKDVRGETAMDYVMAKGRVSDADLFVLLSGAGS